MRKTAAAWGPAIGRRIKVHDRHQLELKLEYQPREGRRGGRYTIDTYLCMPATLNINPETVTRESLYADIHNYVRLKTPELSWSELGALPSSPLVRLGHAVDAAVATARTLYEGKMTACVFRANLRDATAAARRALGAAGARLPAIDEELEKSLDSARSILRRFREILGRARALPAETRAALGMCDEYMSLALEQYLRPVMVVLSRVAPADAATPWKKRLLEAILGEERYRRERGYPSILVPTGDNEPYVYRAGLLKKFCSSALFLEVHRAHARRPWQELAFAVAAGIAMAFATVIAFWAQTRFTQIGLQFFVVLVVAYMFKDRIKEGARGMFARWLERGFYDRRISIADPAGGTLGVCRETIRFVPRERLPAEVAAIRKAGMDLSTRVAVADLDESVIHYRKELRLEADEVAERSDGLTDIVRFHVARLLRGMDDADQEIEYVEEGTYALGPLRVAKTYHVDVVFRFATGDRPPVLSLRRLILDRNGIKRVEQVAAGDPTGSTSLF
jgi:hypothetical protein